MTKSFFSFTSYLEWTRFQIKANRTIRGYQSRLAEAAGCQRSYFSQILKGRIDMTPEQAFGIASFWRLSALEVDYFMALVHLARAGNAPLKAHYARQVSALRSAGGSVTERTAGEKMGAIEASEYYANWHWMAIHTLVAVPGFSTVAKISRRLGVSEPIVAGCLASMTEWGLLARERSGWRHTKNNLHLPSTSPMSRINHVNWRRRAELDMEHEQAMSLHYTAVFAVSENDAAEIRETLLEVLLRFRTKIQASASEDVFAMTLDFLRV